MPDEPCENSSDAPTASVKYVPYPKAMQQLARRFNATPEELAAWVWMGPAIGGLSAYLNANELNPPPRFTYDTADGRGEDHDYVSPLMACWFSIEEISRFTPDHRYITGAALLQRWSDHPGLKPVAFIQAKIKESRLLDAHPIYGMTQASHPADAARPPLETALFQLSDVEDIETKDFGLEPTLEGSNGATKHDADWQPLMPKETASCAELASNLISQPGLGSAAGAFKQNVGNEDGPVVGKTHALGTSEWHIMNARAAANAKHDKPGGSRDKRRQIRELWASGKFSSRNRCAEEEFAALNMSLSAARSALRGTLDPVRCGSDPSTS